MISESTLKHFANQRWLLAEQFRHQDPRLQDLLRAGKEKGEAFVASKQSNKQSSGQGEGESSK